jgi:hypothetical protein
VVNRLACQQVHKRIQRRNREGSHQLDRFRGGPEAGEHLEGAQRHQQFRFVAAIAIVADR